MTYLQQYIEQLLPYLQNTLKTAAKAFDFIGRETVKVNSVSVQFSANFNLKCISWVLTRSFNVHILCYVEGNELFLFVDEKDGAECTQLHSAVCITMESV